MIHIMHGSITHQAPATFVTIRHFYILTSSMLITLKIFRNNEEKVIIDVYIDKW